VIAWFSLLRKGKQGTVRQNTYLKTKNKGFWLSFKNYKPDGISFIDLMHYVRIFPAAWMGRNKNLLNLLACPSGFYLSIYLFRIIMPPAARNLFVKRFLDFQKLFISCKNDPIHIK